MDLFTLAATIGIDLTQFEAGINTARGLFGGLESLLERGLTLAIKTTWEFGKDVIKTGAAFDEQMAAVQAVLGKEEGTVENMMDLRERALEVAEDSVFTSEEVAKAYYYMGMAGWKAEKMSSGLPGVIALAAASGEDLAMVSDIVTDSLTAFGLSADYAQEYADILAQTATNSNTDVRRMGKTFQYIAPIAGQLGVSVEDAALSIGLMANSAIKSSMAGTAFRQILTRITTNAGATSKTLGALEIMVDKLGVSVFDTSGNLRDWSDILEDTRKVWGDVSPADQIYYAKQIASLRGMPAWLALMNTSQENWDDLSESLANAGGAAQSMADVRLDSLSGDVVKLNAAFDVMKIAIYDDVKGPLREVVQDGTESVKRITDAINENGLTGGIEQVGVEIENVSKKWSPALESLGKSLVPVLTGILTDIGPQLISGAVELGASFGAGILEGIGSKLSASDNPVLKWVGNLFGPGDSAEVEDRVVINDGVIRTGGGGITEGNGGSRKKPVIGGHQWLIEELDGDSGDENAKGFGRNKTVADELTDAVNSASEQVDNLAETVGTAAKDISDVSNTVQQLNTDIGAAAENASTSISSSIESGISGGASAGATSLEGSISAAGANAAVSLATAIQGALDSLTMPVLLPTFSYQSTGGGRKKHSSAMARGEILQGLTPFGVDASGTVHYGGEAGAEAVVGVNSLDRMIQQSVNNAVGAVLSRLDTLIGGQNQGDMQMMLDGDVLVAHLARRMDKQMGKLATWRGGGRA